MQTVKSKKEVKRKFKELLNFVFSQGGLMCSRFINSILLKSFSQIMWKNALVIFIPLQRRSRDFMIILEYVLPLCFAFKAYRSQISPWVLLSTGNPEKNDDTGLVEFRLTGGLQYMTWYHAVGLIWISEFILACQQMTVAGAVVTYYFTRSVLFTQIFCLLENAEVPPIHTNI